MATLPAPGISASIGSPPAAIHPSYAAGHRRCSTSLTCGRNPWACLNCITPRRCQVPSAAGPGSRSTKVTSYPRSASAAPVSIPVGPGRRGPSCRTTFRSAARGVNAIEAGEAVVSGPRPIGDNHGDRREHSSDDRHDHGCSRRPQPDQVPGKHDEQQAHAHQREVPPPPPAQPLTLRPADPAGCNGLASSHLLHLPTRATPHRWSCGSMRNSGIKVPVSDSRWKDASAGGAARASWVGFRHTSTHLKCLAGEWWRLAGACRRNGKTANAASLALLAHPLHGALEGRPVVDQPGVGAAR